MNIFLIWFAGLTVPWVGVNQVVYHPVYPLTLQVLAVMLVSSFDIFSGSVVFKFFAPSLVLLYAIAIFKMTRSTKFNIGNHRYETTRNVRKMSAI